MKTIKSLGIVLGLMLAVAFTSCHKDKTGVYAPKKKIQQIYYSWSDTEKEPFQHWEWNGDKLNSITHYSDFDFKADTWVENFTCTWAISYEGDHISKMMGTFYEDFKKDGAKLHLNPLTHLLPPNVCESVNQCEQRLANQRGTKETYTIALLLTWTDNNISKIAFTGDGEYMDFQLQYDDKNCPWYGFMGGLEDYLINFTSGHTGFTKNNVTRIIMTEDDYADTICYAYQYNSEKYPVLQTMYENDDIDDKQVLYFEY